MELKIDQEFEELIPPLTIEEFEGLEQSILENGYDNDKPIVTWNNTIVDGHNRYNVCKKHNIEFTVKEIQFPSRSAAKIWMIDEQTKRRNLNEITRAYLIGTRYLEEKKEVGRAKYSQIIRHGDGIIDDNSTSKVIAEQSSVGTRTVERAAKYAESVNSIVENTGIKRSALLSGYFKSTMRDIVDLAKKEAYIQTLVILRLKEKKVDNVKDGISYKLVKKG
jgi:hypothetical protein